MKTARTIGLILLMVAIVTTMGFAQKPSKAYIINSDHDLRAGETGGIALGNTSSSYALCNFCHIAHKRGSDTFQTWNGPLLWNHTLSSVTTYGVYSSNSFNAYGTNIADLGGSNGPGYVTSNLCLSCHDGTVAIDSFYVSVSGATNTETMATLNNSYVISNLTNTHPVNFTYYGASWIPQAGVLAPASMTSVDAAGSVPLENGKMQCWTCHDAHNGQSGIFEQNFPTSGIPTGGVFCNYCHL
ncbi:putative Cytochrome c family protein [Candidatus Sulfotelmatobacter kueseliae]|jgi:hypothetical protein|uniref:Putative Cytochrome c family protein n=1 Tax=Candidatus Sulfotelmatobacter kueseliae TaxID=2042962 RepID=A0A2U3K3Z9_9BACT|nr:putative Cytochrome c family protein [Candidatus Sulfotelmatobacter kueseliae]